MDPEDVDGFCSDKRRGKLPERVARKFVRERSVLLVKERSAAQPGIGMGIEDVDVALLFDVA